MHDVQVQIRCQRCGAQMDLRDPAPEDAWTPQQFWECPKCGRHFWTTYPPPKPAKPAASRQPASTEKPAVPVKNKSDAGTTSEESVKNPTTENLKEAPKKEN